MQCSYNTQIGLLDAQNGATPQLEKSEQTLGSGGKLTTVLMGDLGEKTQEDEDVLYQSDNGLLVEKTVAHLEEIVEVADWGEEDDLLEAELAADHNIPKRNPPPQATTFSKRVPKSGISVLKLAEDRVAAKNLEVPGMSKTNLFIILQEVDDSSLSSLAVNCGISLDSDVTSELENLTLLRAKELAQAAIQQAIECKKQREELAAVEKHVSNPDESNPLEEVVNPSNQEDIPAPKNEASPQKKRGGKIKKKS